MNLGSSLPGSCPTLDPAIPHSHHHLPRRRASTNRHSYSLGASKSPPTGGDHVNAILLTHHHLNFKLISPHFKTLNAIYCTPWIPIGYRIPDVYEHGCQFMPMGIGMGGYRKFLWVWIWVEGCCTRPYPTHCHPYSQGLKLATSVGCNSIRIHTDCMNLVDALQQNTGHY